MHIYEMILVCKTFKGLYCADIDKEVNSLENAV